jgi:hypothetical protein
VPRDYVEFPSQVNEMWMAYPEVLANYAKHYQTGAPMPKELLDKVQASQQFNEGFRTTEYLAASLLDQAGTSCRRDQIPTDVLAFEAEALKRRASTSPGAAALPHHLFLAHLLGRLLGRLLRLPVGREAGRRHGQLVQGKRRPDPQERRPLPQDPAVARRHAGRDADVPQLQRPRFTPARALPADTEERPWKPNS